ncbi:MAG: AAA family ATPase [Bacteroidales bacterium]|nr:AAA family ATPase [Bacteroidales bacterium]
MALEKELRGLQSAFGYNPTDDQKKAMEHLAAFSISAKANPLYLLKGYAGTGKTSLISAFVRNLLNKGKKFVLLAPTGRAAKVLSQYTGFKAYTIHRWIYTTVMQADGRRKMVLSNNKMQNTIFVVDEASMINDNVSEFSLFEGKSLLDDLIQFTYSESGNKLLLVGDTAQLPPVGLNISPALDIEYLKTTYSLTAFAFEMKEVMRQSLDSGILKSATYLRQKINEHLVALPYFKEVNFLTDVRKIEDAYELEDLMHQSFSGRNTSDSIVVTRSNKGANLFNKQIRNYIQQKESELEAGDQIMVVKNNYFWLDSKSRAGFIANGDIAEVVRVNYIEELYGFRFADAEIVLLDYPEEKELTVKLLLDVLDFSGPSLGEKEQRTLFEQVEADYQHIPSRRKRLALLQKDPYFNALQIKYAYAMTCHKTQGGQWPVVFVEQGYFTEEQCDVEYLRWLYTALTRATEKVYLLGFQQAFFEE